MKGVDRRASKAMKMGELSAGDCCRLPRRSGHTVAQPDADASIDGSRPGVPLRRLPLSAGKGRSRAHRLLVLAGGLADDRERPYVFLFESIIEFPSGNAERTIEIALESREEGRAVGAGNFSRMCACSSGRHTGLRGISWRPRNTTRRLIGRNGIPAAGLKGRPGSEPRRRDMHVLPFPVEWVRPRRT